MNESPIPRTDLFHCLMVRIRPVIGIVALLVLAGCNRPAQPNAEGTEFAVVAGTLDSLSGDIATLVRIDDITNMKSLRAEYSLRFPKRPPLFFAAPFKPVFPRDSPYQLPSRDYYWLTEWSSNDSADAPLFWSYFQIPNDVVSYITIAGSERSCPSNEFAVLVAPLSNRVERAKVEE
jgi:hypothetical protein